MERHNIQNIMKKMAPENWQMIKKSKQLELIHKLKIAWNVNITNWVMIIMSRAWKVSAHAGILLQWKILEVYLIKKMFWLQFNHQQ